MSLHLQHTSTYQQTLLKYTRGAVVCTCVHVYWWLRTFVHYVGHYGRICWWIVKVSTFLLQLTKQHSKQTIWLTLTNNAVEIHVVLKTCAHSLFLRMLRWSGQAAFEQLSKITACTVRKMLSLISFQWPSIWVHQPISGLYRSQHLNKNANRNVRNDNGWLLTKDSARIKTRPYRNSSTSSTCTCTCG